MSSSICEESRGEDDFHLLIDLEQEESPITNEEQQKILKNIVAEFKNNKNDKDNEIKKLCSSYTIKSLPNNKKMYSKTNSDGTTTETQVEKEPSGREKIIQTRYDKNNKVISRKVFYNINIANQNNNNNNNNQNNNNIQNNNIQNNNNNNINNGNRGHIFRANNGFTIETKIERLPNGRKKEVKIIRDENDIVVDVQEDEIFDNNFLNNNINYNHNHNHINMQRPMNNMGYNNNMNSYMPMRMPMPMQMNNPMNMPMNNPMNMQMNNPMNMPMNPMNMNMGMNMGMNMQSMPPMMNNFGYPFMNMMMPMPMQMMNPNRVDPNILNSLPENEIFDASKLDPDNRNCVICLEDFKDKEKTIALPCIHVFHSDCIKSWLGSHNCCPTCKFELTYQNINSHQM